MGGSRATCCLAAAACRHVILSRRLLKCAAWLRWLICRPHASSLPRLPAGRLGARPNWRLLNANVCLCVELLQVAREERLVVMLGALLRRYVEGDALGFKASQAPRGRQLAG